MIDTLERMARADARVCWEVADGAGYTDFEEFYVDQRDTFLRSARAAAEALLEPTDELCMAISDEAVWPLQVIVAIRKHVLAE